MLKFLKRLFGTLYGVLLCIILTVVLIPKQYKDVYTSVLPKKYERLKETDSPKIVLIGGSSMAFGMNSSIIQEGTDYNVVNMGLHAGLGSTFGLEFSKAEIKEGDIIIYAPEYWNNLARVMQPELVLISCQDNPEVLLHASNNGRAAMLRTLPLYCKKKLFFFLTVTGNRSLKAMGETEYNPYYFNEYGDTDYPRKENYVTADSVAPEPDIFNVDSIDDDLCNYLNDLNEYITGKGAHLYFSFAPVSQECIVYSEEAIESFKAALDEKLDAEIISDPKDYIFPLSCFYGTNFHLTNEGADLRSQKLLQDIIVKIKENDA